MLGGKTAGAEKKGDRIQSSFQKPGRKLGDGQESVLPGCKKRMIVSSDGDKSSDGDDSSDYLPEDPSKDASTDEEDEGTDGGTDDEGTEQTTHGPSMEHGARELELGEAEEEMSADYYEVWNSDGTIGRVYKGDRTEEEKGEEQKRIEGAIVVDKRFNIIQDRRQKRLDAIIRRGAASSTRKDVSEIDMSESSKYLDDKSANSMRMPAAGEKRPHTVMAPCKHGRFRAIVNEAGKTLRYEEITDETSATLAKSSEECCKCEICVKRRKNNQTAFADHVRRGELRDGNVRGFFKYGEGQVLGGDKEDKADIDGPEDK